jgi:hypothetical protein
MSETTPPPHLAAPTHRFTSRPHGPQPSPYRRGMIIEAGYDLMTLFAPHLFPKNKQKHVRGTWVVALNDELRLMRMWHVKGSHTATFEELVEPIARKIAKSPHERVAYYCVAHVDTSLGARCCEEFERLDDLLHLAPELIETELLGVVFSDGTGFHQSTPHYSFRDYPALEHLPRAAVIPGPHPTFQCECVACTPINDRIRAAQEAAERTDD